MATVLLTWELGMGIGHLARLRPIGHLLSQHGHRVIAAVQNTQEAVKIFSGTEISRIQAPEPTFKSRHFAKGRSVAHTLGNCGFADEKPLTDLLRRWHGIFDDVKPSLVVTDHSPGVLLALRGRPIPRVNIGLGFFCPPATFPLPYWLTAEETSLMPQVIEDEKAVAGVVNHALKDNGCPPLEWLGQIYSNVEETILSTYQEFDHFGVRPHTRYWGHWSLDEGIPPRWPDGKGPKVYAYLKNFPLLENLLALLVNRGHPTIIFSGSIGAQLQQKYQSPTVRFESQALNMSRVAKECDVAILNANHGTAASILLAGKPCLLIPIYIEQRLFAQRVAQIHAGCLADIIDASRLEAALQDILENQQFRVHAEAFAAKYRDWSPGQQLPEIVERLESHMREPKHV